MRRYDRRVDAKGGEQLRRRTDVDGLYRSNELAQESRVIGEQRLRGPDQNNRGGFGAHECEQRCAPPGAMHPFSADAFEELLPIYPLGAALDGKARGELNAPRQHGRRGAFEREPIEDAGVG